MLARHHLAFHDPYSYSAYWHLWLNHEWLSELLMGAIYKYWGVIGLKLLKLACSTTVVLFLALALAATDAPLTVQSAILLAASVAIAPQMQFRPQLFSFALMSALVAMLARYTNRGKAAPWLAIGLLMLWANLHGGFVVGVAALGLFSAVVFMRDSFEGRGMRRGIILLGIFVASTLATLVTPYGIGTWQAVLHAATNPHTRQVIDDWQPLLRAFVAMWHRNHTGAIPMVVALAMFLSFAFTLALAPKRDDLPMVAIAVVMIAAAFIAMRNLPLAVIATAVPLSSRLSSVFDATYHSRAIRERPLPDQSGSAEWVNQIVLGVVAIVLMVTTGLFSPVLRAGSPRPVGAIAFMQEHRLRGNILADFSWGEYVIWHMAPASKVFIDGRYDTVYPPAVIDDYLAIQYGEPRARDVLRKYPHDFILLSPHDEAAIALVAAAPEWKRSYRDANCILFVRADSEAAQTPAVDVDAEDTPASFFP